MNQRYEGKSLTAFLRVLRKIKFNFYEKLHLIGINKYPYASKYKMFELTDFLDFFHCTYSRKRVKKSVSSNVIHHHHNLWKSSNKIPQWSGFKSSDGPCGLHGSQSCDHSQKNFMWKNIMNRKSNSFCFFIWGIVTFHPTWLCFSQNHLIQWVQSWIQDSPELWYIYSITVGVCLHSEILTISSTPEPWLPICMVQLNEWQGPYSEVKWWYDAVIEFSVPPRV